MRFSTTITMLFREHDFLERFAAARAAGFRGVEIQVMEGPAKAAAEAARKAGTEIVLLNAPMGDLLQGGCGLSGVPGRESAFRDALSGAIDDAVTMGTKKLHVGPSRVPDGTPRHACIDTFLKNIADALPAASNAGVELLVEPVNAQDMPGALFTDPFETARFIGNAFGGEVSLQFDVYHAARCGLEPAEAFLKLLPAIAHVQFSDVPGRGPPGSGTLDFAGIFETIRRSGYSGWVGAEYMTAAPTATTFAWLTKFEGA